jgi:translation initiation factor 2A
MAKINDDDGANLRPIQMLFRSKEAVELYELPDTSSSSSTTSSSSKGGKTIYQGKTTFSLISPSGDCVFVHDASVGVIKCDLNSNHATAPFLKDSKAIQLAKCSPRGSHLLTWERPANKDSNNGNLKVWCAVTGTLVQSFSCKKATLSTLQWTHDEARVFHMVTNEIHIYSGDWRRCGKVRFTGVSSFSVPVVKGVPPNVIVGSNEGEEEKYLLTVFCAGTKGKPARVDLLRYPDRLGRESSTSPDGTTNTSSGPSLASKSLFNAEEVTVQWSPRADSALLLTQTAVDSTGESYYGSTHLFLLLENDAKNTGGGSATVVPLPPESTKDSNGSVPIVSAEWISNPLITGVVPFGVISGRMPALASLHHGKTGEATFLFGRGHRNTLDVSPHGRFVVVGGYGNLAGGMDFWDRNKGKVIPRHVVLPGGGEGGEEGNYVTIKESADLSVTSSTPVVGHQWAPDSRTYLVSTTSPRMNVENGVHVYRYDGSLIEESKLPWDNSKYRPDKLLSAEYVPASGSGGKEFFYYPDRPQSPPPRRYTELKGEAANKALTTLRQSQSCNATAGKAPVASAYVPPAARKAGGGGAYVPPGARKGSAVGGGTSLAERMRQEREGSAATVSGKKVVKRTGPVGGASVGPVGSSNTTDPDAKSKSALRREKQRLAKEKAEREAAEAEQRKKDEEAARSEANKADPEKRAKKIRKTLKQIDEIKAKAASEGVELNEDQMAKVANEESLREELAALGL